MIKIVGISLLIAISQTALGANLPDFPFVVSVGEAEREVKPDVATISLRVIAFDKDSEPALRTVNETTKSIVKLVDSYGIPAKNIEATDIEKSTKRKRDTVYNRLDILGYEVSRSITVKLNNLAKYSELMSDIVAVNNVSSARTAFDISDREKIESELVVEASKDARTKAEQMAKSLGTKVRSVYAISQTSNFGSFFTAFGARSEQIRADIAYSSEGGGVAIFAPKSIKVVQGINVVFKID